MTDRQKLLLSSHLTVFSLGIVLAIIAGGCDMPPDHTVPEADAGTTASPDATPNPNTAPAPPPKPEVSCEMAGEIEDLGPGFGPNIAGSPKGFAIGYPGGWGGSAIVRMLGTDGKPIGLAQNLPSSGADNWPSVVSDGKDGYVAHVGGTSSFSGTARNIYFMDQDGTVKKSLVSSGHDYVAGLASDGSAIHLIYHVTDYNPASDCKESYWMKSITELGNFTGQYRLMCMPNDGWNTNIHQLAARRDSLLTGSNRTWLDDAAASGSTKIALHFVSADSRALKTIDLDQTHGSSQSSISKILVVNDGYVAYWVRRTFSYGPEGVKAIKTEPFLTFVDAAGEFRGTVSAPLGQDIAWNGREFGLVEYNEGTDRIAFRRLAPNGALLQTIDVGLYHPHYLSWPRLAASGTTFGIVWGENNLAGDPPAKIKAARIICKP